MFLNISEKHPILYYRICTIFLERNGQEGHGEDVMEDNRKEQAEALEVLQEFNDRLIKNIGILIKELSGSRLDDTDKFIKGIADAMNWEIQVMNGTMELLNEGKQRIDKEAFNQAITGVGEAINEKDDAKMAAAFSEVLPYFIGLGEAAAEVLGK